MYDAHFRCVLRTIQTYLMKFVTASERVTHTIQSAAVNAKPKSISHIGMMGFSTLLNGIECMVNMQR